MLLICLLTLEICSADFCPNSNLLFLFAVLIGFISGSYFLKCKLSMINTLKNFCFQLFLKESIFSLFSLCVRLSYIVYVVYVPGLPTFLNLSALNSVTDGPHLFKHWIHNNLYEKLDRNTHFGVVQFSFSTFLYECFVLTQVKFVYFDF